MNIKQELQSILLRHEGRGTAIKSRELARIVECEERKVRLMIRALIRDGLPVASSTEAPAGYFVVATRQEVSDYAASLRNRLIEDAVRRRDFCKVADEYLTPAKQGRLI